MSVKCQKPTSLNQLVGTQYQAGREQIDHLQKKAGNEARRGYRLQKLPGTQTPTGKGSARLLPDRGRLVNRCRAPVVKLAGASGESNVLRNGCFGM